MSVKTIIKEKTKFMVIIVRNIIDMSIFDMKVSVFKWSGRSFVN